MSIDIPTAHKANISVQYGQLQPVVDWCERNCQGDWRYMDLNSDEHDNATGNWEFLFESDRDYVAFLIWQK
jgi:hypothetical protein